MNKLNLIKSILSLLAILLIANSPQLMAQDTGFKLKVTPEKLSLKVGEKAQLKAQVLNEKDEVVTNQQIRYFARGGSAKGLVASADSTGLVSAHFPGESMVIVIMPHPDGKFLRFNVPVKVEYPPVEKISFVDVPEKVYTGTLTPILTDIRDQMDLERNDLPVTFKTNNKAIASFDGLNMLTAHKAGKVTITASTEGLSQDVEIEVKANPVASIELSLDRAEARTGDVIQLTASLKGANGKALADMPISYTYTGKTSNVMEFASGLMKDDGRFVAYKAGVYHLTASCGNVSAHKTIKIIERDDIKRKIQLVGRGKVNDKHTSDLWVWEGVDGRDYAVTGTWGADGEAFFWDVTDPANIVAIDTVKVDARTVNDVKISEDGRTCVISREGASNRKNGIIIIDVTDPKNVWIQSEFTDGLTGGVHNLFIYKNHVYALSNGERYDIINIEDPAMPRKVGTFELDVPGHAIHDVWIHDGLAYSSNWNNGIQIVDVGNGMAGGTPAKPVKVANYTYPSGWNHAAFPYFDKQTGKFYVIAGDEAFPYGLYVKDKPTIAAGWLHFIDFSDPKNPKEVAKYEVPGAGSHNFWVDGDVLYVANYNAGLRVVDLAGDLLGDLYKQGREIGWFIPTDPEGVVPNASMTWGPQPHKGHIFFSDWNSGLWSVKMEEKKLEN